MYAVARAHGNNNWRDKVMDNGMDTRSCGNSSSISPRGREYSASDPPFGQNMVASTGDETHRKGFRGWREERRQTGIVARIHRWATAAERWGGWEALTLSGFGLGGFVFVLWAILTAGPVGCGGVARNTAGCVGASAQVCEQPVVVTDLDGWLTYAVCLADDSLPCVLGAVAAGQTGCLGLTECVKQSPCTSVDTCRAVVELCLDEECR